MANLVYNMVCDAFAGLISRKAAENLVKDALRDIGSHPDRVTALEMQELLRKGIFKRLQRIIPVMKAKGEIKQLLRRLEKTLAQPLPGDDSEDWEEGEVEAVDLGPWEVLAPGALSEPPPAAPEIAPPEVVLSAAPLESVRAGLPEGGVPTARFASEPPRSGPPTPAGDPSMSTEETPPLTPSQAVNAFADTPDPAPPVPDFDAEGSAFDEDLFGDASDLFEFEEVDLAALTGMAAPQEPKPALREAPRQEAILSRLALERGVSDVMLSLRSGEVLMGRVSRTEAARLAQGVARAAAGAEGGVPPGLFYADLDDSFILVAPLDDEVLLSILAASSTNLGRLMADIVALKEEL